jgi:hypothetical protein
MAKRWWWAVVAAVVIAAAAWIVLGRTSGPGTTSSQSGSSAAATSSVEDSATQASTTSAAKIAPAGSKLAIVTAPPADMLSEIHYSDSLNGQAYKVTFKVYGAGPVRDGRDTLMVKLGIFTPAKAYSTVVAYKGKNALIELAAGISVTKGGSYSGMLRLAKSGSALVFELTSLTAK